MPELEEIGDQEILEAFLRGDRSVERILLDRLWAQVVGCARKVAADLGRNQYSGGMNLDPEEAANQTLAEFMEMMEKLGPLSRSLSWIHLIRLLRRKVRYRIIDQNRWWHARRRLGGQIRSFEDVISWIDEEGETIPFDPPSSSGDEPEAYFKLHQCLDRLKPSEKELFNKKHLDETTQANLALEYKMPQGTLAVRLMRITGRLRDCLKRGGITGYGRFTL